MSSLDLSSLVGTARASVHSVWDTLAGHGDSSLLGTGSEKLCKWGEMNALVYSLVSLDEAEFHFTGKRKWKLKDEDF